jgi:hypothetical protein
MTPGGYLPLFLYEASDDQLPYVDPFTRITMEDFEVDGVEFTFKDGKVIDARAKKNKGFLPQQLDIDEGARYVGIFGIGLNRSIQRFNKICCSMRKSPETYTWRWVRVTQRADP